MAFMGLSLVVEVGCGWAGGASDGCEAEIARRTALEPRAVGRRRPQPRTARRTGHRRNGGALHPTTDGRPGDPRRRDAAL